MEQMTHARSSMLDDRGRSQRSTLRFLVLLSLFTVTAPVVIMAATSSQSHGDWIKSGSWDKTKFSDAFGYGNFEFKFNRWYQ